jgi:ATP-dependent helicase/nuclease subunit A
MINNMTPDMAARLEALNPHKSFIVQAPAGSGKTELLTQRFLALLNCVKQPEEILSVTFTKKSAAEMRARIINALKRAETEEEPEIHHAKSTWHLAKKVLNRNQTLQWNLLNNPNRLRIQTIDSFNAYLTKQLPILSHFGATPDITDDPWSLYREAVQEFLSYLEENVAWSDAIAQLLIHMDNDLNKVELLLTTMLAKRDQWLPYITLHATEPELRQKLEAHLAAVSTDIISILYKTFPKEYTQELCLLADFAASNLKNENTSSPIIFCANLNKIPGNHLSDREIWLGLSELLLNKEHHWRKQFNKNLGFPPPSCAINAQEKQLFTDLKQRMITLVNHLSDYEAFRLALIELNLAPSTVYEDRQWQTLDALREALRIVVAQLHLVFQKHCQIDYIESAQAAVTALGTEDAPTDMTLALDYQLQHILIDEFQDTSHSQFRLLEKLTAGWENEDGRTLFVVGDPMQSIYRFREAEVGLFIRVRTNGLGHIKLHPLTLTVNFRSTEGIVNWVNEHFQKVLPPFEDIATGAVSYHASTANQSLHSNGVNDRIAFKNQDLSNQTTAHHDTFSYLKDISNYSNDTSSYSSDASSYSKENSVHLHPFQNSIETDQATAIQQLIQKIKKENPDETIAILVRSRSHLQTIIPALKKANCSYRAIDIDPLNTRPVVQDLLSLTRALLHPADRIAWLSILRAPWCGLILNDLLLLTGTHSSASLYERLQSIEVISQLSRDGQTRLNRILPVLWQKTADRYRYSIRTWVESTWLLLGGPASLSQSSELDDAVAFFSLLESLDQTGNPLNIDTLNEKISQLYASPNNQADNSLQIMTIHNAKGLEFDTVILPHLERRSPSDDKQLLLWMERPLQNTNHALLLAPVHAIGHETDSIYEYIKRQHATKTDYENGRLLYVAATRAKRRLHLFFSLQNNDKNEVTKPVSSSLLGKLWNAISTKLPLQHLPSCNAHPAMIETKKYLRRLTTQWENPIKEQQEKISFHNKTAGFQLVETTSQRIGTFIHLLLQQISQLGKNWWEEKSSVLKKQYLQKNLIQLGVLSQNMSDAIDTVLLAIHNTLMDPRGQWILKNHKEAKNEFRLTAVIESKVQSFVIDRTFIDENGHRWIIDYKTSRPNDHNVEAFITAEKIKYRQKMLNYAEAMCKIDQRPIKLGLYFPLASIWCEWN